MGTDLPLQSASLTINRLDDLVRQVRDLPALPQAVTRVLQLTEDPKSGMADVARALSSDIGLVTRVLKLANSGFYGSAGRIGTISEAIVILGLRTTRNIALAASCQEMLEREVQGYYLPSGALWRHSLACAAAAHNLAKRTHYRGIEEAFIAGLLHDIGKIIIGAYLKSDFDQVLTRVAVGDITYSNAEREILGFDHAEAGARILERWNLPGSLVSAVRYHHSPQEATTYSLAAFVHVADMICLTLGVGMGIDGLAYALDPNALAALNLTSEDFEEVASETCDWLSQDNLYT